MSPDEAASSAAVKFALPTDPLFPRRAVLPAQVDACAALIASHAS
jgi:hypothetical protein